MTPLPDGWELQYIDRTASPADDDPDYVKERTWVAVAWGPDNDEKWGWGGSPESAYEELVRRVHDPRPQFAARGSYGPAVEFQPDIYPAT